MGSQATKFCPQCRSEYRPGFDRCADCDVALVDALPAPPPPPIDPWAADPSAHDLVSFEVPGVTDDDRRAIGLLLDADGVGHMWDGDLLVVATPAIDAADAAIDAVMIRDVGEATDPTHPPSVGEQTKRRDGGGPPITRRFVAALIDTLVVAVFAVPFTIAANAADASPLSANVAARWAGWALLVVLLGLTGWTPGKRVLAMRARTADDDRVPGLGRAVVREVTKHLPFWVALVVYRVDLPGGVATALYVATLVAVVAPAIGDPQRRMLHDRVARTLVVDAPRRHQRGNDPR